VCVDVEHDEPLAQPRAVEPAELLEPVLGDDGAPTEPRTSTRPRAAT